MLTPAADRPYIGGSQDNSLFNLIWGYNGIGRLSGNESGSVIGGGATPRAGVWGPTGWLRMFNSSFGGQIAWLIPAALVFLVAGLWWTRRRPRTDHARAALLIWGGWLLLTMAVFSFAAGIIHPYYTVALAPAVGALVGMGAVGCWTRRDRFTARLTMAVALGATAGLAYVLLDRSPTWLPWLRPTVVVAGALIAMALLLPLRRAGVLAGGLAAAGLVVALAAPAASALDTATTPHTGAIPSAGPFVQGSQGGPGGFGGRVPGALRPQGTAGAGGINGFTPPQGFNPANGFPGIGNAAGGPPSFAGLGGNGQSFSGGFAGRGQRGQGASSGQGRSGGAGGIGGLLDAGTTPKALVQALQSNASAYTWAAATVGSNSAAGLQLSSGEPVMSIGGFNGTDPAPSLATFERYVHEGKIHWFVPGGGGAGGGGQGGTSSNVASQITSWVESHFTAKTVGGRTVYDLSPPSS
jgi:4-amino-4-deoxy-L-arabinose transferase-like glycosyltransferase